MCENIKISLKYCGLNVEIRPLANLVRPEMIEVDDDAKIDDFTHINGGIGIRIGKNVHIACFTSIIGGGELSILCGFPHIESRKPEVGNGEIRAYIESHPVEGYGRVRFGCRTGSLI